MVTEQSRGKKGKRGPRERGGKGEGGAAALRRRKCENSSSTSKTFPGDVGSVCLSATRPRSSALSLFSIAADAAAIVLLAKVVRRESDGEMSQKVGKEGDRPTAAGARPGGRAEKTERRRGRGGPSSDKSQSWRSICLPQ